MQAPVRNPVNLHIGRKIAEARAELGMSVQELATALQMTFAEVDQIERGASIDASELFLITIVLQKPVSYFYEGLVR